MNMVPSCLQAFLILAGQHCPGTALSTIGRLLEQAQQDKPAAARLADQLAGYFVTGVLLDFHEHLDEDLLGDVLLLLGVGEVVADDGGDVWVEEFDELFPRGLVALGRWRDEGFGTRVEVGVWIGMVGVGHSGGELTLVVT